MPRLLTFRFAGLEFKIPRWTTFFFGIGAVVLVGGSVYRHFYPLDLVSLEEANHALSVEIQEYGRHLADHPRQAFDAEDLVVRIYPDRCLLIQRKADGAVWTKLVPDLARTDFKHRPGDEVPIKDRASLPDFIATLSAEEQRRCLNPHPGQFQTAYGKRDGCWVEVWRQWPDGCTHVQMFEVCRGFFDTNPDGTPRIRWTSCNH